MKLLKNTLLIVLTLIPFCLSAQKKMSSGATEKSVSRAQYFSWINNTNEGPTEEQTLINLNFFRHLCIRCGMRPVKKRENNDNYL